MKAIYIVYGDEWDNHNPRPFAAFSTFKAAKDYMDSIESTEVELSCSGENSHDDDDDEGEGSHADIFRELAIMKRQVNKKYDPDDDDGWDCPVLCLSKCPNCGFSIARDKGKKTTIRSDQSGLKTEWANMGDGFLNLEIRGPMTAKELLSKARERLAKLEGDEQ